MLAPLAVSVALAPKQIAGLVLVIEIVGGGLTAIETGVCAEQPFASVPVTV